ncbi:hypothetical protein GUJ93_ZPchr0008g11975 [Zizania palustris]|uniref:Uncharacterized protein n=1 Tax=Zizania palustris TaxID=103762 RepID=A0A8J5R930_ZIZPA|nr:hypothetical protein GUJ93_ZPchr0008g11975 [Zizania palustris]
MVWKATADWKQQRGDSERYQETENGLSFFFNNKLELGAKIGGQKRKVELLVAIAVGRSGGGGSTSEGIERNCSSYSRLDCRFSCFMEASVRRRGGAKGKMGVFVRRTHHHRQLLLLLEAAEFTTTMKAILDLARRWRAWRNGPVRHRQP